MGVKNVVIQREKYEMKKINLEGNVTGKYVNGRMRYTGKYVRG